MVTWHVDLGWFEHFLSNFKKRWYQDPWVAGIPCEKFKDWIGWSYFLKSRKGQGFTLKLYKACYSKYPCLILIETTAVLQPQANGPGDTDTLTWMEAVRGLLVADSQFAVPSTIVALAFASFGRWYSIKDYTSFNCHKTAAETQTYLLPRRC